MEKQKMVPLTTDQLSQAINALWAYADRQMKKCDEFGAAADRLERAANTCGDLIADHIAACENSKEAFKAKAREAWDLINYLTVYRWRD